MKILWTLPTEQDRADIVDVIAQDNKHPCGFLPSETIERERVVQRSDHVLSGSTDGNRREVTDRDGDIRRLRG